MILKNYFKIYADLFKVINVKEIDYLIEYLNNFDRNKKIYVIGNGGSAALAEHFAQDLSKKCFIPAISLTNICNITAFGNDCGYGNVFADQLEIYGNRGDCLICFTSSGNSDNINYACARADLLGIFVVSFTGFDGGFTKGKSDINIHVPYSDYGVVESLHSLLFHFIIDVLYDKRIKDEENG